MLAYNSHNRQFPAPAPTTITVKITIIQVGKTKHSFFQEAEAEYQKRLKPLLNIETITLKEAEIPKGDPEAGRKLVKAKEAAEIIKNIPKDSYIIALDERGKQFTSLEFASFLNERMQQSTKNLVFIIGGPYGLEEIIKSQAKLLLSFSKLTFTHECIRTLLLEQIYRAHTILGGKTYHY
ncbi:23S rRNA (pseudouridine(1915)-N(3))-methyltransferase RlmH [Candidatus Peregrinibacteria bacterium]|nr:23S rRNA (pseudouridine(1915)-N(3))-methyltransferase RlmH [Candidatus Peregrinibacteria bacterium]